jgi:hypothetical protein
MLSLGYYKVFLKWNVEVLLIGVMPLCPFCREKFGKGTTHPRSTMAAGHQDSNLLQATLPIVPILCCHRIYFGLYFIQLLVVPLCQGRLVVLPLLASRICAFNVILAAYFSGKSRAQQKKSY